MASTLFTTVPSGAQVQYRCGTSLEVVTSLSNTASIAVGPKEADAVRSSGKTLLECSNEVASNNIIINDDNDTSLKVCTDGESVTLQASNASFDPQSATQPPDPETLYAIWKKNVPFLYSGVLIQHLDWPSLSVDWLTPLNNSANAHQYCGMNKRLRGGYNCKTEYTIQKVLLGTQTNGLDPNYLVVADIKFPKFNYCEDPLKFETNTSFNNPKSSSTGGGVGLSNTGTGILNQVPQYEVKAMLLHPGDVNRALHMPQKSFILCSQSSSGCLLIYDYAKHPSTPASPCIQPQIVLYTGPSSRKINFQHYSLCNDKKGGPSAQNMEYYSHDETDYSVSSCTIKTPPPQDTNLAAYACQTTPPKGGTVPFETSDRGPDKAEGFGLSWNLKKQGILVSSNNEGRISIFDINGTRFTRVNSSKTAGYSMGCLATSASQTSTSPTYVRSPLNSTSNASKGNSINTENQQAELLPVLSWVVASGSYGSTETYENSKSNPNEISAVNDVTWHPSSPDIFASGGDDGYIRLWDTRANLNREREGCLRTQPNVLEGGNAKPSSNSTARCHKKWIPFPSVNPPSRTLQQRVLSCSGVGINVLSFNRFSPYIISSGSSNGNINVFDIRNICQPLVPLSYHTEPVTRVAFAPGAANVLASTSEDRKTIIWDIARSKPSSAEKQNKWGITKRSPGSTLSNNILFIHGGHKEGVMDICWCNDVCEPWLLGSVGYDNTFQAWSMSDCILWNACDCE